MNISAVGGSLNITTQSGGTFGAGKTERNGDSAGGERVRPGGRGAGGPVLDAVVQTLNQLGLGTVSTSAPPPVSASAGTGANNDVESAPSSTGQSVGEALHGFMHALFQALGPGGAGGSGGPPPRGGPPQGENGGDAPKGPPPPDAANNGRGYGDLATRLESLIQSLGGTSSESDSTTATGGDSDATSALDAAFQNLKSALQGSNDSAQSGTDLQTFLKALEENLGSGRGGLASTGNVINTSV
jgi:hypothetical protein